MRVTRKEFQRLMEEFHESSSMFKLEGKLRRALTGEIDVAPPVRIWGARPQESLLRRKAWRARVRLLRQTMLG